MILILLFVLLGIGQGIESYAQNGSKVKEWAYPVDVISSSTSKTTGYVQPIRLPKSDKSTYYLENQDSNPWRSCAFKDAYGLWPKGNGTDYTNPDLIFNKMKVSDISGLTPPSETPQNFKSATKAWVDDFKKQICLGKKVKFVVFPQDYSSPTGFIELPSVQEDSAKKTTGSICPLFFHENISGNKSDSKSSSVDFFGNKAPDERKDYFCKAVQNSGVISDGDLWTDAGDSRRTLIGRAANRGDAYSAFGISSKFNPPKNNFDIKKDSSKLSDADNVRLCLLGMVKMGLINNDQNFQIDHFVKKIQVSNTEPSSYETKKLSCFYPKIGEKIIKSVADLKSGLKIINDKYYGYEASDKKLPSLSMDYCPEYLDRNADQLKNKLSELSNKSFNSQDVETFFGLGSNIKEDAPKYGIHYFKSACVHPVNIVNDDPIKINFKDSESTLTPNECQRIVDNISGQFNKIKNEPSNSNSDVFISSLTLLSSASTLNNGEAKNGEYFFPKQFKALTDARNLRVEECIRNETNYLRGSPLRAAVVDFNKKVGAASSSEKLITRISSGTNEDGTTGECAYNCKEKKANPDDQDRYCTEEKKDFINAETGKQETDDRRNQILDNYQFTMFSVKFIIKRKAPTSSGHYIGAAQRCFRVSLSCSK